MARKDYDPASRQFSVEDVQEIISEANALIGELKSRLEGAKVLGSHRSALDALTERQVVLVQEKLRECNRAVAQLKTAADSETLSKRAIAMGKAAIELFLKLYSGGKGP
jgi:hypothetical protein